MNVDSRSTPGKATELQPAPANSPLSVVAVILILILIILSAVTLGYVVAIKNDDCDKTEVVTVQNQTVVETTESSDTTCYDATEMGSMFEAANPCAGKKPGLPNKDCIEEQIVAALEQAGMNVTKGYQGQLDTGVHFGADGSGQFVEGGRQPINQSYWKKGLCPVNVHWHLGAEHLSAGEYDESAVGPSASSDSSGYRRKLQGGSDIREGYNCYHYDASDKKFTTEYDWKHCVDTHVGYTYEVHWPHSAAGACGTPNQYQTPFYDGVFCIGGVGLADSIIHLDPQNTYDTIGVQGQVFTIVNDEDYYYPDLIRGMIVDGAKGTDVAAYTGSTTGTSRNNQVCSQYTPITWQVDRKCHMISASAFDKMCADMKAQRDDMSDDLYPHGARELVAIYLAANNHQDREDDHDYH